MKRIRSWADLKPYGITILTGEACGLTYRVLCDVNDQGKAVLEKLLDAKLDLPPTWNEGVGSIMLPYSFLAPIGVFALLESGCTEVWTDDEQVIAFDNDAEHQHYPLPPGYRRLAYDGTAGSRNRHEMSGRIR